MNREYVVEPGQQARIDVFRPEDAPMVAQCFKAVYGDAYPVKTYYDPGLMTAAVESGKLHLTVARTPEGRVVGAIALYHSGPFERIYEVGAGLVLPEHRGGGLAGRLMGHLAAEVAPRLDAALIWGEPVCNHTRQQRVDAKLGFIPGALEVNLMPASAYAKEESAGGRVTTLCDCRELQPRPHDVHLPPLHAAQLAEIYAWSTLERRLLPADEAPPAQPASQVAAEFFGFAGVARLTVWRIGADLPARLAELEAQYRPQGLEVMQLWLNLSQAEVGWAARQAKAAGFFLGGLLARWFDSDGMLLQKLFSPVDWDSIQVALPQSQRLKEMVRADHEEV